LMLKWAARVINKKENKTP